MNFAEELDSIRQRLVNELTDQKLVLSEASVAFVGNDQGERIQSCFDEVLKSIGEIFDFLTRGDNSLKEEIIRVANEYKIFAEKIRDEFLDKE